MQGNLNVSSSNISCIQKLLPELSRVKGRPKKLFSESSKPTKLRKGKSLVTTNVSPEELSQVT